jgi:hypothetical protein
LIAIFTVLGLLLFGGGAYAIYDGWPYLVLERGFTEVIIGSIASSAGLIMLSLAWVLKEGRATRRALLEAIELRAQVPLPAAAPVAAAAPLVAEAPIVVPRVEPEAPAFSRTVAPAALGAVAGAVATGAVAHALATPEDENVPAPAEAPASSGDRDLFGALVAQNLEEPEPATETEPEEASETVPAVAEDAAPLPDMFDAALSMPPSEPAEPQAEVEADVEAYKPFEPVAAELQPDHEEWTFPGQDEPAPSEEPAHVEQPVTPVAAAEIPAETQDEVELDEFSALRASLAGHLNEPEPEPETGRIEPSFSQEPDPFAAAETWMDRASPRREPWLDTPPAEEPAPVEEPVLHWPPRTEPHAFEAPAEPVSVAAEAETRTDPFEAPVDEPALDAAMVAEEPAPAAADLPEAEEAPAAADSRPASDEGIVGAYQVGDAHFTIYADGSIRARTPDGEYSFASMDELKVYLASEKSRLGV